MNIFKSFFRFPGLFLFLFLMIQVQGLKAADCDDCNDLVNPTNCGIVDCEVYCPGCPCELCDVPEDPSNCGEVGCDLSCPNCDDPPSSPDLPVDQGIYFVLFGGILISGYVVYRQYRMNMV